MLAADLAAGAIVEDVGLVLEALALEQLKILVCDIGSISRYPDAQLTLDTLRASRGVVVATVIEDAARFWATSWPALW